jgi:2-phospho-L-lactate guanylyltransferase (CobY/MobA/RfbA family)
VNCFVIAGASIIVPSRNGGTFVLHIPAQHLLIVFQIHLFAHQLEKLISYPASKSQLNQMLTCFIFLS